MKRFPLLFPTVTFICLHLFDNIAFETLVICCPKFDDLIEVEDNDVGKESNGNHCDNEVVVPECVRGTPDGLVEILAYDSYR